MNVRILWVRAMKCLCAQTRPRFILSSERVFREVEFEPMLTPRAKSPLPENFLRGGSNPRRCGQRAQTLPSSYSGPRAKGVSDAMIPHLHESICAWEKKGNKPTAACHEELTVVVSFVKVSNTMLFILSIRSDSHITAKTPYFVIWNK